MSGMSSGRSRSGGSVDLHHRQPEVEVRAERPAFTSARRSRLVAAMIRTSTGV